MTLNAFAPVLGPGLLGVAFLGYGLMIRSRGKATIRWRPVQGKIIWSLMDEREVRRGRGALGRATVTQYRPDVRYWYTVGGVEHECAQIFVGDKHWHSLRVTAQPIVDKYPVGRELRVFHNPAQPEQAVLERGQVRGATKFILLGAGFLAMALLTILAILMGYRL